jgi:hypothetical protein
MLQGENGKEHEAEWNNTRVQRILVDYMLRNSYYDTALKLAEMKNIQVCRGSMAPAVSCEDFQSSFLIYFDAGVHVWPVICGRANAFLNYCFFFVVVEIWMRSQ